MSDVERLRREVSLSQIAMSFGVDLQPDGHEFIACCPMHDERTPSFTVFRGNDGVERFHCFGCGAAGDVLDFVQGIKGVTLPEAIKILGGGRSGPNVAPARIEARDIYAGITPIEPVGEIKPGQRVTLWNPKRENAGSFAPSMVFPYRRASGELIGYVLRHDLPDGGKETPMVMRVRLPDGRECWCRYPFPKPRPLYGLDRLGDDRQVVVVEGEKCADAMWRMRRRAVVSWAGGTYGIKHTDWSPLEGRDVIIWPDADSPGRATGQNIQEMLSGIAARARVINVFLDGRAA